MLKIAAAAQKELKEFESNQSTPRKHSPGSRRLSSVGSRRLSWRSVIEAKSAKSDESDVMSVGSGEPVPKLWRETLIMPTKAPHLPCPEMDLSGRPVSPRGMDYSGRPVSPSRSLSPTPRRPMSRSRMTKPSQREREQPRPYKSPLRAGPRAGSPLKAGLRHRRGSFNASSTSSHAMSKGILKNGDRVEVRVDSKSDPNSKLLWKAGFVLSEFPLGASSRGEKVRYVVVSDDGVRKIYEIWQIREIPMSVEGFCAAAGFGLYDVVRAWVEGGGRVGCRDKEGLSALQRACTSGNWEVVHYLVEEANCFVHSKVDGFTAFELAFINGNLPVIQYIVRHKILSTKSSSLMDVSIGRLQDAVRESRAGRYLNSREARASANHFVTIMKPFQEDIDISNVLLIPRSEFLRRQEFRPYEEMEGSHVKASLVNGKDCVLYLSHRWEEAELPDPDGRQYALVQNFLEESDDGKPIKYLWIDFSCLPQRAPPGDARAQTLKRNVATVIFLSSHCLVLPSTVFAESNNNGVVVGSSVTDLNGFSKRAWFQVEVVCCLLSCCKIFTAYSFATMIKRFVEVGVPSWSDDEKRQLSGPRVYGGMEIGGLQASEGLGDQSKKAKVDDHWHGLLQVYWGVEEKRDPTLSLERLYQVLVEIMEDKQLLGKMVSYTFTAQDLNSHQSLHDLANNLGDFSVEQDKVDAIQMLIFVLLYSMGKVPSKDDYQASANSRCSQS